MGENTTATKDNRPVILWDCDDSVEYLSHDDKDSAIEDHLDTLFGDQEQVGKTITVYGYARMIAPKLAATRILDEVFEGLWAEYIGEDWDSITPEMEVLAQEFADGMHAAFVPWACEVVTTEEVSVADWIAEHRPDWLEDRRNACQHCHIDGIGGGKGRCQMCGDVMDWELEAKDA